MICCVNVIGDSNNGRTNNRLIEIPIIILLILTLHSLHHYTQKRLNQSQFTDPPAFSIPSAGNTKPITNNQCATTSSEIEDAINCFENQQFNQANIILQRVKSKAIKTRNIPLLLQAHLYLSFVAIETGKIKTAETIIKHILFLNPSFNFNLHKIKKKKYTRLIEKVRKNGRHINEIEINEITKKSFIRVHSCKNSNHCKDGIWLEKKYNHSKSSLESDLDCSLYGNCDAINKNIDCSMTGDCENDLDCSLDGTC